jgi:hypothetical protein
MKFKGYRCAVAGLSMPRFIGAVIGNMAQAGWVGLNAVVLKGYRLSRRYGVNAPMYRGVYWQHGLRRRRAGGTKCCVLMLYRTAVAMVSMPSPAAWAVIGTMSAKAELNAFSSPCHPALAGWFHRPYTRKLLLKTHLSRGR